MQLKTNTELGNQSSSTYTDAFYIYHVVYAVYMELNMLNRVNQNKLGI